MTKASNQRMSKRSGSQSNANSRASGSDGKHDREQQLKGKSMKSGVDNQGKRKDWQGGAKQD